MQALMALVAIPLMIINLFGGIVSGVWLAILGEWWALGIGIVSIFAANFFLMIVMLPGMAIAVPGVTLLEKGRELLAFPFVLLSQLYTHAVITIWCMASLFIFISRATESSFWPLLIWSYGVALGPWMFLASKEPDDGDFNTSANSTFFAQIGYLVIAVMLIFGSPAPATLAMTFSGIMVVALLINTVFAYLLMYEQKRMGML